MQSRAGAYSGLSGFGNQPGVPWGFTRLRRAAPQALICRALRALEATISTHLLIDLNTEVENAISSSAKVRRLKRANEVWRWAFAHVVPIEHARVNNPRHINFMPV